MDKAREAKDILRHYDILRVNEISVGLTAFFNWVSEREREMHADRPITNVDVV